MSITLDTTTLLDISGKLMDGHVRYTWGGKPGFNKKPEEIVGADCSGFVRYVVYQATSKKVSLSEGSWGQHEWCKTSKLETVAYSTARESDGWLRLAFINPEGKDKPGHVWMILDGKTLESYGGHGPGRRSWDTGVLVKRVGACYKLSQTFTQHQNNFLYGKTYFV